MNRSDRNKACPIAYVLGMDANGLGVARSLGRRGIRVVGLDSRPNLPGMKSRYIQPLTCGDPMRSVELNLRILNKHAEGNGRGILYPTTDAFVLMISRHRKELEANFDFNMPPANAIEAVVNKRLQYQAAQGLSVDIPRTFYPNTMADVTQIIHEIEYPAFIKPFFPFDWYLTFGSKGFLVKNDKELINGYQLAISAGIEVMVQEFVVGPSSNMYSVATYVSKSGWMAPPCTWQKVRQAPVDFGVGSFVRTTKAPKIEEMGVKFLKGIGYTGIAEIEFKKDDRDGEFKLIELNARSWLQNPLTAYAGIDTSYLQYLDLTGAKLPEMKPCREGVRWIDLLSDLQTFWVLRRRGELTVKEWIRSWLGAETHAYGAIDDPRPLLSRYEYGKGLAMTLSMLLKGGLKSRKSKSLKGRYDDR